MNYCEIKLTLSPFSEETAEIIIASLADLGCDSFEIDDSCVKAYIAENIFDKNTIDNTIAEFKHLAEISCTVNRIKAQNWNAVWESNFEPIVISDICLIRAPFHDNSLPAVKHEVVIMPKMSFGTGHHATTYLIAEALLYLNVTGLNVLDMGCGTGILAIIAAQKNAAHIDAVDIDEWAFENAQENIIANGVSEKINVILGDAAIIKGKLYDLILANINRNIILADIKQYSHALKHNGRLIVSGIFTDDIEAIEIAAKSYNLTKVEQKSRDNWARIQFVKAQ